MFILKQRLSAKVWWKVNPIQDGLFWGCSRMEEGGEAWRTLLTKICYTYPTMMKIGTVIPYLKKIQKLFELRDAPLEFCWHQHFFTENQKIVLYHEIQIQIAFRYIIFNSSNFLESLLIVLINMVKISMISAKMATLCLLKIKIFWKTGYDVIISVRDGIKKFITWFKL